METGIFHSVFQLAYVNKSKNRKVFPCNRFVYVENRTITTTKSMQLYSFTFHSFIHGFTFHSFSYPWSTMGPEADDPPSDALSEGQ